MSASLVVFIYHVTQSTFGTPHSSWDFVRCRVQGKALSSNVCIPSKLY